jgi:hypothetical protein
MRLILIASLFVFASSASAQDVPRKYALTEFNNEGCLAKGAVQNCASTNPVMRQILADGKDAIPILISQLAETSRAKLEIVDYWGDTRSGDVAFIVLTDLFADEDGHSFLPPGVPGWDTIMKSCEYSASGCWVVYLRKHGRKSVQDQWQQAWGRHKNEITWDASGHHFRVSKP